MSRRNWFPARWIAADRSPAAQSEWRESRSGAAPAARTGARGPGQQAMRRVPQRVRVMPLLWSCQAARLIRNREFWNRHAARVVIENDSDRNIAADVLPARANDVGQQARAFAQFDNGDDIGQIAFEAGMIQPVIDNETVDSSLPGHLVPCEIRAETMVATRRGGKPELAAGAAMQHQHFVLFRALPVGKRFGRSARQRFFG